MQYLLQNLRLYVQIWKTRFGLLRMLSLLFTVLDPEIEGQAKGMCGVRTWGTSLLMLDCHLPLDALAYPEVVKEETTKE